MYRASNDKQLYIILSQTGTILSRILRILTGAKYNHASVSLDPTLEVMYSFGRLNPYNPFLGGFVKESKKFGTFKRFTGTRVLVLAIPISADKFDLISEYLSSMYNNRNAYGYNYWGLYLAALRVHHRAKNRYYCSEFVKDILLRFDVTDEKLFTAITQPAHFMQIPDANKVYEGELKKF